MVELALLTARGSGGITAACRGAAKDRLNVLMSGPGLTAGSG